MANIGKPPCDQAAILVRSCAQSAGTCSPPGVNDPWTNGEVQSSEWRRAALGTHNPAIWGDGCRKSPAPETGRSSPAAAKLGGCSRLAAICR